MATRRSTVFDNVDPGLARAIETVSRNYKPYRVEAFSGHTARPRNPSSYHPRGGAIDVNLYDPKTNAQLANIQDPSTATAYQGFANELYRWAQQNDPELAAKLRWGGYFKDGQWNRDWMHFDIGGAENMKGGSWAGGFDQDYVTQAKLASAGGIEGLDAQMQAAGYTPEQRRNAIASIESAGSGDYAATGAWSGDPVEGRDRAYGRYQVMGANIGPWAEKYLQKKGITSDQFLADPALQDQLFDAVYGDYVKQYGERGAASKWFTGSEKEPNVTDVNGKLTGKSYADKYMAALSGTPHAQHPPNPQTGTGGYVAPGAPTTQVAPTSPYGLVADKRDKKDTALEMMAKAAGNMGQTAQGWQQPQIEPTPGAARVDQPAQPLFDPQQTAQRQQLAQIMLARLNQGTLT